MTYDRTAAFGSPLQSELEPQPLAYVFPPDLRHTLLGAGMPPEKIPGDEALEPLLRSLEVTLDEWLGYRIAPTKYIKERSCQVNGILTLECYPVLEIISVKRIKSQWTGKQGLQPQTEEVDAFWEGGRNLKVPSITRERYRVEFVAGYDPVPPIIKETLLNLLKKFFLSYRGNPAFVSPGDLLAHLSALTRDLTQVNLPGGISQTFRIGNASGGGKNRDGGSKSGDNGGTELDRALLPLLKLKLRRQTIT